MALFKLSLNDNVMNEYKNKLADYKKLDPVATDNVYYGGRIYNEALDDNNSDSTGPIPRQS